MCTTLGFKCPPQASYQQEHSKWALMLHQHSTIKDCPVKLAIYGKINFILNGTKIQRWYKGIELQLRAYEKLIGFNTGSVTVWRYRSCHVLYQLIMGLWLEHWTFHYISLRAQTTILPHFFELLSKNAKKLCACKHADKVKPTYSAVGAASELSEAPTKSNSWVGGGTYIGKWYGNVPWSWSPFFRSVGAP